MCSLNGEDMVMDDGDSSVLIPPPPKRRKVTAVRDGCGSTSVQNSMHKKEVVGCRIKEERSRDLSEAEEIFSEESERLAIPVCSNGVDLAASSSKAEYGVEELLDMPIVNPKESQNATEHEVVGEGTSVQPCELPHYPIPPNLGRKECFPPRRKVSAIRDFPDGCGPNVPSTDKNQAKHLFKSSSSMAKVMKKERRKRNYAGPKIRDFSLNNKRYCNYAGVGSSSEKSSRRKVKDTLRLFNNLFRKLAKKPGGVNVRINKALKIFRSRGKRINTRKRPGPVPGVEVGDFFSYRAELSVIGLHGPNRSGIDFVKQDNELIATSVVASGRYDNMEKSDVLIYSGQGGNVEVGCKQDGDQKLEKGNLALKNSIDKKNLVRVILGCMMKQPRRRDKVSTYTYDGLYTVESYWSDHGNTGNLVYKFELRRVPNQPEVTWKDEKQSKASEAREGCCVKDISKGKDVPICAVNTIDDEIPSPFMYINEVNYPEWYQGQSIPHRGCDCKNGCSDSRPCTCTLKNGGEIPYNESGEIVDEKSLVYECGPSCKCPPSCHNRVSQHGIKLPLEVFKTESKGWGVRCLSFIPSGSFICEYIGELLGDKEAEQRIGNDEYLFDIGQNYCDPTIHNQLSALLPDMPSSSGDVVENLGFTLDAGNYGNVGRFINHSCSPNIFAQNVLYDHEDKRIPHVMFFAAENIPPLQELTYHYNYKIDQVVDSEGNIRKKHCYCGSSECTGRMY